MRLSKSFENIETNYYALNFEICVNLRMSLLINILYLNDISIEQIKAHTPRTNYYSSLCSWRIKFPT